MIQELPRETINKYIYMMIKYDKSVKDQLLILKNAYIAKEIDEIGMAARIEYIWEMIHGS